MAKDDVVKGQGSSGDDAGEGALDTSRVAALSFPLVDRFDGDDHKVFRTTSELRRHPATGRLHRYSLLLCPHWVNVIARTSEGRYIFIHQWRAGTDEVTLEIPGGMVDPGEPALKAAHRELMEETGYKGSKGEVIGVVHPNPALQNNQCTTVLVEGCAQAAAPTPDAGELIEVCTLSADEVRAALKQGHIRHALVVAAFAHLMLKDSL